MMTLVDTELVGRTKREQDPSRKRDRLAAVRYGRARMNPYRRPLRPGQWAPTLVEAWARYNDRFIGASIQPHRANPGFVRMSVSTWFNSARLQCHRCRAVFSSKPSTTSVRLELRHCAARCSADSCRRTTQARTRHGGTAENGRRLTGHRLAESPPRMSILG